MYLVDTPLSESRFADMLEGWVDDEREVHDEHDTHPIADSHEHDDNEDGNLSPIIPFTFSEWPIIVRVVFQRGT